MSRNSLKVGNLFPAQGVSRKIRQLGPSLIVCIQRQHCNKENILQNNRLFCFFQTAKQKTCFHLSDPGLLFDDEPSLGVDVAEPVGGVAEVKIFETVKWV